MNKTNTSKLQLRQSSSLQSEFLTITSPLAEHIEDLAPAVTSGSGHPENTSGGSTPVTPPPQLANWNIDTLALSYHIMWDNGKIFDELAEQKKAIQSGKDKEATFKFGNTSLFSFNLQRTGNSNYAYILRCGDITISLNRQHWSSTMPNCMVEIGSLSCQQGVQETVRTISRWFDFYGCNAMGEKVSRIDIAADVRVPIAETMIDKEEFHISRSSKCARYTCDRKLNGIMIGAGDIVFRCYDKIQEMKTKQSFEKEAFFRNKWGGDCEHMTRAEFQVRRGKIKEFLPKKSDLKTVLLFLPKLWKYLTTEWFRQAAGKVDRANRHQDRAEVSKFWKIVQEAACVVCSAINRNRKQLHTNIPALLKMAAGCLTTIAASMGLHIEDVWGVLGTARDMITNHMAEIYETEEFKRKFAIKQAVSMVTF